MVRTVALLRGAVLAAIGLALAVGPGCAKDRSSTGDSLANAQRFEIEVSAAGYVPASVEAVTGRPIALVFRRTTDDACGGSVVIATLGIERELPRGEAVEIALPPQPAGSIDFTCAMDMMRGSIVVK